MNDFKLLFVRKSFFPYLWFSQILSSLTINIMNFLLLTYLYSKTGSTIATSLLWICYMLPAIIIGPFAAAMVDMVDRRKILIYTNLSQTLIYIIYAFILNNSVVYTYLLVLIYSFFNQLYVPAEAASLPSIVKKEKLPTANSLFFVTLQLSLIVGFGVAGILKNLLGFTASVLLCGLMLFLAFVSTIFLPSNKVSKRKFKGLPEMTKHFVTSIYEGYTLIKENNGVLFPFLILIGLQVALSIVIVTLPAIAKDLLQINIDSSGSLIVVPAGIGALLGAFMVSKFLKKGWRKKKALEIFLITLSLSVFFNAFILWRLEGMSKILLAMVTFLIAGVSYVGILIPTQTFLQEETPQKYRGRVFGNFWFITTSISVIPILFSATITELFGIKTLFSFFAVVLMAGAVLSLKYGQKILEENYEANK